MPAFPRVSWWVVCVYTIFGLLFAGIVLPRFLSRSESGPNPTRSLIASFETSLRMYAQENGRYPTTEQGLQALLEKPARPPIPPRWQRYMDLPALPNDVWGRPFLYECPGPHGSPFLILSLGKDGRCGTNDDIEGVLPAREP